MYNYVDKDHAAQYNVCNSVFRRRRKLSSHVRWERGCSSFSMVDSEDSSD